MAIKKSQLYSSIWEACDELRGGMDSSEYKDYVLTLLFVRYVSDKYANKPNSIVEIPEDGSFSALSKLKGKTNIGESINIALAKLAKANGLQGVVDSVDFDDEDKLGKGKEKQDRLSKLVAIFENPDLDFSNNRASGDDLLGDAYEYLMKHFAVESGKSKGQFYTPAEVSRIMAKIVGAENATHSTQSVYDPTCGSGSLLLKVAAEAKPVDISIFGQEKENATASLAILNMWLHSEPTAVIKKGQSTLSHPLFTENEKLKRFDYVVANPPFSYKSWRRGFNPEEDPYNRFDGFGMPPDKNGDYAFLLHIVKSLKSTGKGAVVLPHGVLFRGNAEEDIRTNLVNRGYIEGVIGLPSNLFFGTGIPACIIVIDKENAQNRDGIFMIDASKGFIKDGNKNRLREQDIRRIVDTWKNRKEIAKYSHFASDQEIEENEYNLNLPRYIDTSEKQDQQNIEAHLKGGIPQEDIGSLDKYWQVYPSLKDKLFEPSKNEGLYSLNAEIDEIRASILENDEFLNYKQNLKEKFNSWCRTQDSYLQNLNQENRPKKVIEKLANSFLKAFQDIKLIDKYDLYQQLMNYWREVMQDDVYIITSAEGWEAGKNCVRKTKRVKSGKNKGQKKNIKGLEGLQGQLVPISLMIEKYFAEEQAQIDELNQKINQADTKMDEMEAEHTGEGGVFEEAKSEAGNVTLTNIRALIKDYKDDPSFKEELGILTSYMDIYKQQRKDKKELKKLKKDLEQKLQDKYPTLNTEEVKTMVVEEKWFATIQNNIMQEVESLSQKFASRIQGLAERYQKPLPEIEQQVEELEEKVEEHLDKMGFEV
jgi:type I restriction enzyme M protein